MASGAPQHLHVVVDFPCRFARCTCKTPFDSIVCDGFSPKGSNHCPAKAPPTSFGLSSVVLFFLGVEFYPLVNDHIAGWKIPIFNRIHTSTQSGAPIFQPAMLDYRSFFLLHSTNIVHLISIAKWVGEPLRPLVYNLVAYFISFHVRSPFSPPKYIMYSHFHWAYPTLRNQHFQHFHILSYPDQFLFEDQGLFSAAHRSRAIGAPPNHFPC